MAKSPLPDPVVEISLPEVLQLVERLYQQLERSEAEVRAKGRVVEEHALTIEGLNRRVQGFRESFQRAREEAERYQD